MIEVEVFSKADCHLCDEAKETLKNIQQKHLFDLRIHLLKEGDERFEEFKERFPVIMVNKEFEFCYRVNEMQFLSALRKVKKLSP